MVSGWCWRRIVGGVATSAAIACLLGVVAPASAYAESVGEDIVVLGDQSEQTIPMEMEEPSAGLAELPVGDEKARDVTGTSDVGIEVQASSNASSKRGITVNGKAYAGAQSGSGRDGGTWSWDGASNLVLNGYRGGNISVGGTVLNVKLKGSNVISGYHIDPASDNWTYNGLSCSGADGKTSVKVSGSGSLKIDAGVVTYDNIGHSFGVHGIAADSITIEGTRVSIDLSRVTGAGMGGSQALLGTDVRISKGSKVVAKGGKEMGKMTRGAISGTTVTIIDSTVQASAAKESIGGSIYFYEGLHIENSVVKASYAPEYGFAIFTNDYEGGTARIINSEVTTPSFMSGKIVLKSVIGATAVTGEYGDIMQLKPSSGSKVRLAHTGGVSAYGYGAGYGAKSLSPAVVALPDSSCTYDGKAKKLKPVVSLGGKTLSSGTDYVIAYKANKSVGTATVTVAGTGAYSGLAKSTFKIVPKGTTVSKLVAGKGALTASWKKQATQTSGYQLQYTAEKSFSGAKAVKVSGPGTISKKVAGLERKKAYRVRIRTYKEVGTKTYYSSWSAAISVKTQ